MTEGESVAFLGVWRMVIGPDPMDDNEDNPSLVRTHLDVVGDFIDDLDSSWIEAPDSNFGGIG